MKTEKYRTLNKEELVATLGGQIALPLDAGGGLNITPGFHNGRGWSRT